MTDRWRKFKQVKTALRLAALQTVYNSGGRLWWNPPNAKIQVEVHNHAGRHDAKVPVPLSNSSAFMMEAQPLDRYDG
eukprot:431192-Rhodomonas_salina.1